MTGLDPLPSRDIGYITAADISNISSRPHLSVTHPALKIKLWLPLHRDTEATAAKSLQSCPTLCDPIDGSPPGSPVPGILQARTLEWAAISFSNARK